MSSDPMHPNSETSLSDDVLVSKTQKKKAMLALQDLGETLAALSVERLRSLNLPESLYQELRAVQSITKWEARRRQMQYIGKLMRHIDSAPIRDQLARWAAGPQAAVAAFHELETLREQLLVDPSELDTLLARFPLLDRKRFRSLLEKARDEQTAGKKGRFYREVFRELKKLFEASAAPQPETLPADILGSDNLTES